ncbi:MAG: hypothetical protein KDA36_13195, partial [Planctomycetaceae bacterium]|nr:hypothetical protein [Planctomycetaceae bacterium]
DLKILFRDNSESPKVLSGLDSLFNIKDAPEFDAYDPEGRGASAGLNFEHIISGHRNRNNKFTPRSGRYSLHRISDQSVQLVRKGEDGPWNVASTFTYRVVEPHYVDFEFRLRPGDATLFGERGWGIFFFANYMNDVAEVPIRFLGVSEPNGKREWISGDATNGTHPDWNSGGTYRHVDAPDLEYDADHDFRLNNWSYDWPRYSEPFYYGRAAEGMTLILMFDRDYSPEDEIRFSLFKYKVPKHPRPAWDFQYVVHKLETGKEYGFRGRLVWKKFVDEGDVVREYESWRAGLGK